MYIYIYIYICLQPMTPYQITRQNFESLVDKEINGMFILRVIL